MAQTINAANYIYFAAENELQKLRMPEEDNDVGRCSRCWIQPARVFNEELLNLHRGQGIELYWRDTLQPPTEAEYLQMVNYKTGGLFRLTLRLMKCCAPAPPARPLCSAGLDDGDGEIDVRDDYDGRGHGGYPSDEEALLLLDDVVDLLGFIYQILDDYKNMEDIVSHLSFLSLPLLLFLNRLIFLCCYALCPRKCQIGEHMGNELMKSK